MDKGVKELYFEQGVFLPEDCSGLFSYESLEKIDLSEVDVTGAANMLNMFKDCYKLSTIVVPKNASLETRLPGMFVDENENYYSTLPMNMSESFTITKDNQNEWLSDFDYYITGEKIVLTGYHGTAEDLVVPGRAVFGDTAYTKVEITPEINWDKDYYLAHLSFADGVVVPDDCSRLFDSYMLESIDMSNIDTSHVTNMSEMFKCRGLKELNLSRFDTSSVTDMSGMFMECYSLPELDLSGFDTSNVTDMSGMFKYCGSLTRLNVRGLNTSSVTNMSSMFYECSHLTEVAVSGFDTSNVEDMSDMFFNCSKLTELDVSGFNTENLTMLYSTFYGCISLLELDLSNWDLRVLRNGYGAFSGTIPVIKTSANVTTTVELRAVYTGSDGNTYTRLPFNADCSILLNWMSESISGNPSMSGEPSVSGNPSTSGNPV